MYSCISLCCCIYVSIYVFVHLQDRYGLALSLGKKKPGSPSSALASAILGKSYVFAYDSILRMKVSMSSIAE